MSSEIKNDCCSEVKTSSICPLCNTRKQAVDAITLKHWLVASLVPLIGEGPFFFCDTKDCAVIYFSRDHSIQYTKEHLRDRIASKEASGPATVCYCFGVSKEMISEEILNTGKSAYLSWIGKEVKQGNCACEIRNPAGNCCLGEVKKVEADYLKRYDEKKNTFSKPVS